MAGSSVRNSLHRRNHKERGQLPSRARLGLLEKHKDYVQRAKDYHSKKDRLKRLKEKASLRNKDEFYFGMVNSKTEGGVHVQSRGNAVLSNDVVKILKTQDANYIRTQRMIGVNKINRLKAHLSTLLDPNETKQDDDSDDEDMEDDMDEERGAKEKEVLKQVGLLSESVPKNARERKRSRSGSSGKKKIVFVDGYDDLKEYQPKASTSSPVATSTSATPSKPVDEEEESFAGPSGWILAPASNKRRKSKSASSFAEPSEEKTLSAEQRKKQEKKTRNSLVNALAAHLKRDTQLRNAEKELELQKALMGKGGVRKTRGALGKPDEGDDEDDEHKKDGAVGGWRGREFKWRGERKK